MIFSLLTLFPEMYSGPFNYSIIKRAITKQLLKINLVNIRDFTTDSYRTVDGKPYGGGQGMILRVDILDKAINHTLNQVGIDRSKTRIILTDARGRQFNQKLAKKYLSYDHVIIIAGHYEGFDERVTSLVDECISIGKFILTGGELPSMVICDTVSRMIPGVLRNTKSFSDESFFRKSEKEYPQYTEPREFNGLSVPEVLLSGNHQKISDWKKTASGNRKSKII